LLINKIVIENFKSIRHLDIDIKNINLLIGSNGAGKSNFIQFFRLLNSIVSSNLQNHIVEGGGADNFLFFGRKVSSSLSGLVSAGPNEYNFELAPTEDNKFYFKVESTTFTHASYGNTVKTLADGNKETNLIKQIEADVEKKIAFHVTKAMTTWRVYHFHDTSSSSKLKQTSEINDNRFLKRDASNLAAFLFFLQEKHNQHFKKIENTIRIIAPFFDCFDLHPLLLDENKIRLEWKHINSEQYFNANHLSDGTLRMICIITLFLQPHLPDTIIIDEPELGLHPSAIQLLASLIKSAASQNKQVICSTQSVTLLNQFGAEDIIVVDRENNESHFKRLNIDELSDWIDEYSIGELWEKNLFGGRP
jgi:predicted ATPase